VPRRSSETEARAGSPLIDGLFRREFSRIVASLVARVGADRIELAEDAVQDAMIAALRAWPRTGMPNNPGAWLHRASRNALIDRLRRARFEQPTDAVELFERPANAPRIEDELGDEALSDELVRMLIYCCHPSLSHGAQVALTLRLACGLSIDEIAHALFATPESISQRIVRAKETLRRAAVRFELPETAALHAERLHGVLQTLYLLFDAGYLSTTEGAAIRPLLMADALRLTDILLAFGPTNTPATRALGALLHLVAARLPARYGADGALRTLEQQDRSLWDRERIARGFQLLGAAAEGAEITRYHIEAAIAAVHARAPDFAATDWHEILRHYDLLLANFPSPAVAVSRAIAVRYAQGPDRAWRELMQNAFDPAFENTVLNRAARAELLYALEEYARAIAELDAAIALAENAHVKDLLSKRRSHWLDAARAE
jgi:RNA polymerase sigma-70 factor, ECF subfamily